MSFNPEFRRNLWLEISPYRLIGMPLILGAIFYLGYLSDDHRLGESVAKLSTALLSIIALIWGSKLASETVMNEIRDHTWDGQRMSVITPWQLTLGKLFGSTVYPWYGALICTAAFCISNVDYGTTETLKIALILILSTVLAHSVSLLSSLIAIQKERKTNRGQTAAMLLLGIIVAGPFFSMALGRNDAVQWYGLEYSGLNFLLASITAFALWGVISVIHMMRIELKMKNMPWTWLAFVLFCMLYISGFFCRVHNTQFISAPIMAAHFVAVAAVYFMAFAERKDRIHLQMVIANASSGNWRGFLERAPRWLLTIPYVIISGAAVIATAEKNLPNIIVMVIAIQLFIIRDLAMMLFCNLAKNNRRADMLFALYLALLYGIFPAILMAMDQKDATVLFWPQHDSNLFWGIAAPFAGALVVCLAMIRRWKNGAIR